MAVRLIQAVALRESGSWGAENSEGLRTASAFLMVSRPMLSNLRRIVPLAGWVALLHASLTQ
mgnify:CR=1 FL=1